MNTGNQTILNPQQSETILSPDLSPASKLQENDAVNLQALDEEEDVEGTSQSRSLANEDQAAIRYNIEDGMRQ